MNPTSTPCLNIQLLGDFAITLGSDTPRLLDKPRQRSLLAYLAYRQGKPQTRSNLAFSFWPDSEEKQALTNLRNLLHGLRQSLPEIDPFLEIDKQSITLIKSEGCLVDSTTLSEALQSARQTSAAINAREIRQTLENAADLYHGPLLPKFHDEWIHAEREVLALKIDGVLDRLIKLLQDAEELTEAIRYSKIRIQHEGLSEGSQLTYIDLLARSGDRAAALSAYNTYKKRLQAELDISPGPELLTLHQKILQQTPKAPPLPPQQPVPPPPPWQRYSNART